MSKKQAGDVLAQHSAKVGTKYGCAKYSTKQDSNLILQGSQRQLCGKHVCVHCNSKD